jgi:hypothetical protein
MSDQPDRFEQILTEITGLRTGLGAVKTELGAVKTELGAVKTDLSGVKTDLLGVRTDLMGRMDRLQDSLTAIRDDIGVNMGRADAAVRANASTREDVRGLEEQFGLIWRKIRHLENRVREIGGDP